MIYRSSTKASQVHSLANERVNRRLVVVVPGRLGNPLVHRVSVPRLPQRRRWLVLAEHGVPVSVAMYIGRMLRPRIETSCYDTSSHATSN